MCSSITNMGMLYIIIINKINYIPIFQLKDQLCIVSGVDGSIGEVPISYLLHRPSILLQPMKYVIHSKYCTPYIIIIV